MTWSLMVSSLALAASLSQAPAPSEGPPPEPAAQAEAVRLPGWLVSFRVTAPVTTTDPQHVAGTIGVQHTGAYRMEVHYQPTDLGKLGMIYSALGMRLLTRERWQLAVDLEHSQARPVRRLFRGNGWELDGHDRHQLSLGTASVQWRTRQFFGWVDSVELGFGRMHIWRRVSARAGAADLSPSPDPILESSAPVGILGVRAAHRLPFGLDGQLHARLVGAGRSRGGEVPFAHATVDWTVTRPIFHSRAFGRGSLGLVGNHATNFRAVSYFQNGLGVTLRLAF